MGQWLDGSRRVKSNGWFFLSGNGLCGVGWCDILKYGGFGSIWWNGGIW